MRILVTGANKGIGRAICEALLAHSENTHVLLASRDLSRGAATRDSLVASHPAWAARVEVVALDVTDDASVAAAAAAAGPLWALVCNAGVGMTTTAAECLGVNLHGVKRCVDAFVPHLAADARVVFVSSGVGPMLVEKATEPARSFLTAPQPWAAIERAAADFLAAFARKADDGGAALAALGYHADASPYFVSKALLNVYALHVAATTALTVSACSPGFIATDLTRASFTGGGKTVEEMGALAPELGTVAVMRLLFGDGVARGAYYGSDGLRSPLDKYRAPGAPEYVP